MPILDDIPEHLRSPDQKDAFLTWVKSLPVEPWVRRGLTNLWQKRNDVRFSSSDYYKAGL